MKVWDWRKSIQASDLKPMTKLVLYTLANYMNNDGGSCFPNQEDIATGTGLDLRSISRHIKEAKDAGYIDIIKIHVKGQRWKSNSYQAQTPICNTLTHATPVVDSPVVDSSVQSYTTPDCKVTRHPSRINSPINSPINSSLNDDEKPRPLSIDSDMEKQWIEIAQRERGVKKYVVEDWMIEFKDYWEGIAHTKKGKRKDWLMTWKNNYRKKIIPWDLKEKPQEIERIGLKVGDRI